ncbi:MAG: zinc metalloprotease [Carboxylicivirga sp.]|jgi:hypothetical protein|nr:zinc metalloprotease [Carboxylicivirga sp.]
MTITKTITLTFTIGLFLTLSISCNQEDINHISFDENYIYKIPVVVHIIHNGEAIGKGANISFEQIKSQIEVLNEDFRRIHNSNGYCSKSKGVDTQIEFYLAPKDPNGITLNEAGVHRVNGGRHEWPKGFLGNPIETTLKPQTIWDTKKYFNIWTVNFGGFVGRNLLGYAQFPSNSSLDGLNTDGGSADTDGIVIGYKYFGSSEKGNFPSLTAPFNLGRTTTHETGHWLGLRHIWGDGDCGNDDYCNDTPPSSEPTFGCPDYKFTCDSPDMIENYMDYSDDICMNTFTNEQKNRMLTVLKESPRRKELVVEK